MYLTDEEMTRMVESVIEELEYRGISIPKEFKRVEGLSKKYLDKAYDHIGRPFTRDFIAVMDTSFLKNASKGFVVVNYGLLCKGQMVDVKTGKSTHIYLVNLLKIEEDPSNADCGIYTFTDGTKKVLRNQYNEFVLPFVQLLLDEYQDTVNELGDEYYPTEVRWPDESEFVRKIYKHVNAMFASVVGMYTRKVHAMTYKDRYLKTKELEGVDPTDEFVLAYALFLDGYVDHMNLFCSRKYSNEDLLEELGYSLIVEDTVDSLKLAFICYSLLYEKGDFKSLNPMLVIVCRLQELLEDGYFHDIENDIKKVILLMELYKIELFGGLKDKIHKINW